jgi:hypothetical protein
MKFALTDKDGKHFHDGIAPTAKAPPVVTWGNRVFLRGDTKDDATSYREVDAYRIGGR